MVLSIYRRFSESTNFCSKERLLRPVAMMLRHVKIVNPCYFIATWGKPETWLIKCMRGDDIWRRVDQLNLRIGDELTNWFWRRDDQGDELTCNRFNIPLALPALHRQHSESDSGVGRPLQMATLLHNMSWVSSGHDMVWGGGGHFHVLLHPWPCNDDPVVQEEFTKEEWGIGRARTITDFCNRLILLS